MMKQLAATLLASLLGVGALAQDAMSTAEVRRVDKSTGKITLKHGEIRNLDMPPMTMVFTARDKTLLDNVKPGDKVQFRADKDAAGEYVLTAIEPQKQR